MKTKFSISDIIKYHCGETTEEEEQKAIKLADAAPKLLIALKTVFDLIDRGVLVRDISKDDDYNYFLKQGIEINNTIVLMNEAIKKAIK